MKLSTSLLSTALLASAVLAAPSGLAERVKRRQQRRDLSAAGKFPIPASLEAEHAEKAAASSAGNATLYFSNWSGAIIQTPPEGTTYTAIEGTFVVPQPSPPVAGPGTWSGTAWVGIYDNNAILQSGVDWQVTVDNSGAESYQYNAWWEWLPNGWTDYNNFAVNAGDEVSILCEAQTTSTAICQAINSNSGVTVTQTLSAPSSSSTLQAQSAAWIVEDYSSGGLVPFANFGTVTFTDCNAEAAVDFSGGQDVPLTSEVGTEADIVANGAVITAVTFDDSSNSLQVTYV